MNKATAAFYRTNGRPTLAGDHSQNEVHLSDAESFFWVIFFHRVATGGTANIASLRVNFDVDEESTALGNEYVNFSEGKGTWTTTTDGATVSKPDPATDLASVGDVVMRVVYGETAGLYDTSDGDKLNHINCICRTLGSDICKASNAVTFPLNYVQNMKRIGRARGDTGGVANDADSPYTLIDERLLTETCVLQADGTFYTESAL